MPREESLCRVKGALLPCGVQRQRLCRGSEGQSPSAGVWGGAPSIHAECLREECYDVGEEDEEEHHENKQENIGDGPFGDPFQRQVGQVHGDEQVDAERRGQQGDLVGYHPKDAEEYGVDAHGLDDRQEDRREPRRWWRGSP